MADEFDPYYTWLGIPPAEQPADHYRLLGLRQFERNADVISNAADQKMQFLRTLQVGKRAALSQKLLNEISAAGGCLLDSQKKQSYDTDLKAKEAAKQAAATTKVTPVRPLPKPSAVLPLPAVGSTVARPAAPRRTPVATPQAISLDTSPTPRKEPSGLKAAGPSQSWKLPALAVGGGLGLLVLAAIVVYASGMLGTRENEIASPPTKNVTPIAPATPEKKAAKPPPEITPPEKTPNPKVVKSPKAKTPGINVTTPPPAPSSLAWWKDPAHAERLLALQIGTSAHAELPDTASRSALATPLTAELWLRLHLQGDQPVRILGTILGGEGVVPKGWGLIARRVMQQDKARSQLYVEFWKPNNEYVHYPVALVEDGAWHHVALVLEPEKPGRIFLDGKPTEFAAVKDVGSSQRNLVLGSEMQPPGANFNAEVCGLRVSAGARYSQPFTPPSPLAMPPDDATFAAVDCRLMQPSQISGSKTAYPWLYGMGRFDDQRKEIVNFQPLRYGTQQQWQGGAKHPSEKLGWIALDAIGGHVGNDADHAAVRRWVAPRDGELTISGQIRHFTVLRDGDGVRARIVIRRPGLNGASTSFSSAEWRAFFAAADTQPPPIKVQTGDTVDFAVDCGGGNAICDAFEWIVDLKLVDAEQRVVGMWNSAKDFRVAPILGNAGDSARLREPALSGAKWIQLENHAAVASSRDKSAYSTPAKLVAQYFPAVKPTGNSPLTLKPVPVKPKEPSPFGEVPPVEIPAAVKKSAVPDADAVTKAKAEVMSVFGDEFKAAKSPPQKEELARKIFALAKDTTEPTTRYALLLEVRRLAVEGKDAPLATKTVETLGEQFEVDLLALKIKLLESLAAEGLSPAQRGDVLSATCDLGYEALDAENHEVLPAIIAIARSLMAKAVPPDARAAAKEFLDAYGKDQKQIETIKKAEKLLATAPNEPGANLLLGLYYFFKAGDRKKGLAMLAKGSDQKLASAAKLCEQNMAKGIASTLEEADAWYDAAGGVSAEYKPHVQKMAHDGYAFLAGSGTGLEKVKAEKRRDELAAAVAAVPERKGTKRVRASDFPEFTNGFVGRVLINGKDAGILVTSLPGQATNYRALDELLEKSKATGLRVVMEGYLSCPVPTDVTVYQNVRPGGPGHVVSIDGNQVSAVGGNLNRSNSQTRVSLLAGEHLVQWAFDYVQGCNPSAGFSNNRTGQLMNVRHTRQQAVVARKLATTAEENLSN